MGPLEFITIQFKGNKFKGEIAPALREVIEKGIIRIVDLVFVKKDADGNVSSFELSDIDKADLAVFDKIAGDITGLLSEQDIAQVSDMLENDSSALLMLFEHAWAVKIKEAVQNADGKLVVDYHVPADVAYSALDAMKMKN